MSSHFLESRSNREATLYFYDNFTSCGDSEEVQALLLEEIAQSGALAGVPQRKRGLVSSLALSLALDMYDTQQQIKGLDLYRSSDWSTNA